ncbi:LytTR family DNA-binding domain-containing protein [Furfurilactobacillus curtus]|uniref:HTH LytTR-type domain-containing protein n=1 Tax=Furfurilactobacillus curtus TaxID=1746200 RepID=A0ABQ5JKM0_9LACO
MEINFALRNQSLISVTIFAQQKTPLVGRLITYLENFNDDDDRLLIRQHGQQILVEPRTIVAIEIAHKELTIATRTQTYHTFGSLTSILNALPDGLLFMVSQSVAINLRYLNRLDASFSGTMMAQLDHHLSIAIFRRYVPSLRKAVYNRSRSLTGGVSHD